MGSPKVFFLLVKLLSKSVALQHEMTSELPASGWWHTLWILLSREVVQKCLLSSNTLAPNSSPLSSFVKSVELQQLAVGCALAGATFIFNPFPYKFFFPFFSFPRAISNHASENSKCSWTPSATAHLDGCLWKEQSEMSVVSTMRKSFLL